MRKLTADSQQSTAKSQKSKVEKREEERLKDNAEALSAQRYAEKKGEREAWGGI
jgi:hypothetical protein